MVACQRRRHRQLGLEDHVTCLNRQAESEQDYKDRIHERLNSRCVLKFESECWLYLGGCEQPDGQIKLRVGQRIHKLGRVAAWLYIEGFELWDGRYEVVHRCNCLRCFNPEHLEIVKGRGEAMHLLHALGKMRQQPVRLAA